MKEDLAKVVIVPSIYQAARLLISLNLIDGEASEYVRNYLDDNPELKSALEDKLNHK